MVTVMPAPGDAIPITACGLGELDGGGGFEVIINATSAGLSHHGDQGRAPAIDPTVIGPGCVAYDLLYAASPTPFMRWARAHGAVAVSDGLGMLVEQAAESYHLWHGQRPRTGPVIAALRSDFAGTGAGEAAA